MASATEGRGIGEVGRWIARWAMQGEAPRFEEAMLTNLRQKLAARRALDALQAANDGLARQLGDELLAVDVQRALDALGEIVGETTADDLLEQIFSEFCIGK